jgi:hypothetical protein
LFSLLETVGIVAGFEDVAVVGDAIQQKAGSFFKDGKSRVLKLDDGVLSQQQEQSLYAFVEELLDSTRS